MPKRKKNNAEARIERAYYAGCSGVQINIMDIPKVFRQGDAVIAAQPEISDAELVVKIRAIVDNIIGKEAA